MEAEQASREQLPHPRTVLQQLFSWLIAVKMQEIIWGKTPSEAHPEKNQDP